MSIKSSQKLVEEANEIIETLSPLEIKSLIDKNEITLNFSLDVTIKLFIEKIEIYLDDLDMPWPTGKKPMHK